VLRFLGKRPDGRFRGEAGGDLRRRAEGVRLKHRVNGNSVKVYDKQGSVLRVETTVNDPRQFKVYRGTEADPGRKAWRPLRKGVADLHRRAEVSHKANERYLEALAATASPQRLQEVAEPLCRRVRRPQRARALNPLSSADAALLAAVQRGEFALNGFRNRDLRQLLHGDKPGDAAAARRQSAQVTRQIRLLRAHGLVKKVTGTHRYLVTDKGRSSITAILAARQADTAKLAEAV